MALAVCILAGCATQNIMWQYVTDEGTFSGSCPEDELPYNSLKINHQGILTTWYENGHKKDIFYYIIDGNRYTNYCWYANGNIKGQFATINAILDGKFIAYDKKGNKRLETNFRLGREDGKATLYNKRGKATWKSEWINGEMIK